MRVEDSTNFAVAGLQRVRTYVDFTSFVLYKKIYMLDAVPTWQTDLTSIRTFPHQREYG